MDNIQGNRKVYLALGGNVGEVRKTIQLAINAIQEQIGDVVAVSSFIVTEPLNPPELEELSQPRFLNAVLICSTNKQAAQLLSLINEIESSLGRNRKKEFRWGPRTIDIDIIDIEGEVINDQDLCVPHKEMHKRTFVLEPLLEIEPDYFHSVLSVSGKELLGLLLKKEEHHIASRP